MKSYINRFVRFVRRVLGIEVWHNGICYGTTKEMAEAIDKARPFVAFVAFDPELSRRFVEWQNSLKVQDRTVETR